MNARHEGIFASAEEAITFACNYSSQQYAMSPMAKILQRGAYGSGRGLVGVDGAGQAGMVFAELCSIDHAHMLILVARRSQRKGRCECRRSCCSGWAPNPAYRDAISQLTDLVMPVLGGAISVRRFRQGIVEKHFGEKVDAKGLAADLDIPPRTAERHASLIRAYLKDAEKDAWTEWCNHLDRVGMLTTRD